MGGKIPHYHNMKYKVITENAAEFFQFLTKEKKPFFGLKEVEGFMPSFSKDYIKEFIQDLVDRELVMRLKKGLYVLIPYDTPVSEFYPDWHLTASVLVGSRNYYIGYYTALQLHDLTTQPSLLEQVVVDKRIIPAKQNIKGIRFQFIYHNKQHFFGTKKTWVEFLNQTYTVQYSDLEKTIIDCLYKPNYAGGIVEVAKAIYRVKTKLNFKRLLQYLKQMGSQAVIKRLGFLLELYNIETPILEEMQGLKTVSYIILDPIHPKEGKTQRRWSVQINVDLETIKQAPFS